MPTPVGIGIVQLSQVNIDSDLTIPLPYALYLEKLQAVTGGNLQIYNRDGLRVVYIDSQRLGIDPASHLRTPAIYEGVTGNGVSIPHTLKIDTLDNNSAAEISILEDIALSAGKYVKAPSAQIDTITDQAGTGAVDFSQGINVDDITEYTGSHGIDLNSAVTLASLTTLLTQMYRTAGASDTQRDAEDAEASIGNPGGTWTLVKGSITIPASYVGAGNEIRVKWQGKTQNAGGLPKQKVYVNGAAVGVDKAITNSYAALSDDISGVSAGDVITIYTYDVGGTTGNHFAKELRVCCDDTISDPLGALTW